MKRIAFTIALITFSFAPGVYAQVEETKNEATPPDEVPAADVPPPPAGAKAVAAAPRPAQVKSADTIKGNAGKDVAIVVAKGECASGLRPLGIINKNPNWSIKAAVDVQVVFMGRM